MEQSVFIGREFWALPELENYIRVNGIKQSQVVAINNSSTYKGNGSYYRSCFLYFYADGLTYDMFSNLPAEQQEIIKLKPLERLTYDAAEESDWHRMMKSYRLDPNDEKNKGVIFEKGFSKDFFMNSVLFPISITAGYDEHFFPQFLRINPYFDLDDYNYRTWDWKLVGE